MQIKTLEFELTSHCNSHCPHCPRFDDRGNLIITPKHLPLDIIKEKIDFESFSNLTKIMFQGSYGDPLMYPYLLELIEYIPKHITIYIVTNGSIRSADWWKKLAKFQNVIVIFSIDGLEHTNHLYRINTEFKKIIQNASTFISNNGKAHWKYLLFQHNEHQINDAIQLSKSLGFRSIGFFHAHHDKFWGLESWPVYVKQEYKHEIKPSFVEIPVPVMHISNNDFDDFMDYNPIILPANSNNKCKWGKLGAVHINAEGRVLPCCFLFYESTINESHFLKLVGNINDISLKHNTLTQILSLPFYSSTLENSLKSIDTMHLSCKSCFGYTNIIFESLNKNAEV